MAASLHDLFWEIHSNNPREGPGSDNSTRRAFELVKALPSAARLIDIGCGPGAQTLCLASLCNAFIVAVDSHRPFIERLRDKVERMGYGNRINAVVGDMKELDFDPHSFDCIWAEGSIYIIGVENGLRQWKHLLKKKGSIAFTEISWLSGAVPNEAKAFWTKNYPEMSDVGGNLARITKSGYLVKDYFVLPKEDWWKEYYEPIAQKLDSLKEKYKEDAQALNLLEGEEVEMEIHHRYSDSYSYVFYVAESI